MNEYCTWSELKSYAIGDSNIGSTSEAALKSFCTIASRMFDGSTHRVFYPHVATRYYDMPPDDSVLVVDDDLLAVTTFTTQNDEDTVSSSDYYLMCGGSYNLTPYDRLSMKSSGNQPNLLYSGTVQKSQKVTGTWGYHDDWSNAFQDSGDTVQNSTQISSSGTSLTVSDADGADIYGEEPRFREQHLLKIDSEYLYVTKASATTNVLTVRRGVNGTTAAAHTNGTSIYVYRPVDLVFQAVRRLAKWLREQAEAGYTDELATVDATGTMRIPKAAPVDVKLAAGMFKRVGVG